MSVESRTSAVAEEEVEEGREESFPDEVVGPRAQQFHDRRINQEIPGEEIDAMLRENGIEPGTDAVQQFMEKWDWNQAVDVLRQERTAQEQPQAAPDPEASASVEAQPEGNETLEGTLEARRTEFAQAEHAYSTARKNAKGFPPATDEDYIGTINEPFRVALERYRAARNAYHGARDAYAHTQWGEDPEGGRTPEQEQQRSQFLLRFIPQELETLKKAQLDSRGAQEQGRVRKVWSMGLKSLRTVGAITDKTLDKLHVPKKLRLVTRWMATGAVGGAAVVFGAPLLGFAVPGMGAAYIGARIGRSVFGGAVGATAAGMVDVIAERFREKMGLTQEDVSEHMERAVEQFMASQEELRLEDFIAQKEAWLAKRLARAKHFETGKNVAKVIAALGAGGIGGYVGWKGVSEHLLGTSLAQDTLSPRATEASGVPRPTPPVSAEATPSVSPNAPFDQEQMNRATVGKGKGIQHAFRAQLENDPEKFGFKQDLEQYSKNNKAVWAMIKDPAEQHKAWAAWKAHRIAEEMGFVKGGKQLRVLENVRGKSSAYVLEAAGPDGKPKVSVIIQEKSGAGKIVGTFDEKHQWDGKPIEGGYVHEAGIKESVPKKAAASGLEQQPGRPPRVRAAEPQPSPQEPVAPVPADVVPENATSIEPTTEPSPDSAALAPEPPAAAGVEAPDSANADLEQYVPEDLKAVGKDPFGNAIRKVVDLDGRTLYFSKITNVPSGVRMPEHVSLVAMMDGPEGSYQTMGMTYSGEGAGDNPPSILRLNIEELAPRQSPENVLRMVADAARERLAFIDRFSKLPGWNHDRTVDLVSTLVKGDVFKFNAQVLSGQTLRYGIVPGPKGVFYLQSQDPLLPRSAAYQLPLGNKIEDLTNLPSKIEEFNKEIYRDITGTLKPRAENPNPEQWSASPSNEDGEG